MKYLVLDNVLNKINEVVSESKRKLCSDYRQTLNVYLKNHVEEESEVINYIRLLFEVFSFGFKLDDYLNPFTPMMVIDGKRTPIPSDFTVDQINKLKELYECITDDEIKARIADVLWVIQKSYKYAQNAISHYLNSAIELEDWTHWTHCFYRIKRALQLSLIVGKKDNKHEEVFDFISDMIIRIDGQDPLYLSGKLLELLIENKKSSSKDYLSTIEKNILNSVSNDEFEKARYYIGVKAMLFKISGEKELYELEILRQENSFEKQAEKVMQSKDISYIQVVYLYEEAVKTLRTIPGQQNEVNRILGFLPKYKKIMQSNFKSFRHEVNPSPIFENVNAEISGRTLKDSIIKLAYYQNFDSIETLRSSVIKFQEESPISFFCSTDIVDENGKRIIKMPSSLADSKDNGEIALVAKMYRTAAQNHSFFGSVCVSYGLSIINKEHEYGIEDLDFVVSDNIFVPEDRI